MDKNKPSRKYRKFIPVLALIFAVSTILSNEFAFAGWDDGRGIGGFPKYNGPKNPRMPSGGGGGGFDGNQWAKAQMMGMAANMALQIFQQAIDAEIARQQMKEQQEEMARERARQAEEQRRRELEARRVLKRKEAEKWLTEKFHRKIIPRKIRGPAYHEEGIAGGNDISKLIKTVGSEEGNPAGANEESNPLGLKTVQDMDRVEAINRIPQSNHQYHAEPVQEGQTYTPEVQNQPMNISPESGTSMQSGQSTNPNSDILNNSQKELQQNNFSFDGDNGDSFTKGVEIDPPNIQNPPPPSAPLVESRPGGNSGTGLVPDDIPPATGTSSNTLPVENLGAPRVFGGYTTAVPPWQAQVDHGDIYEMLAGLTNNSFKHNVDPNELVPESTHFFGIGSNPPMTYGQLDDMGDARGAGFPKGNDVGEARTGAGVFVNSKELAGSDFFYALQLKRLNANGQIGGRVEKPGEPGPTQAEVALKKLFEDTHPRTRVDFLKERVRRAERELKPWNYFIDHVLLEGLREFSLFNFHLVVERCLESEVLGTVLFGADVLALGVAADLVILDYCARWRDKKMIEQLIKEEEFRAEMIRRIAAGERLSPYASVFAKPPRPNGLSSPRDRVGLQR